MTYLSEAGLQITLHELTYVLPVLVGKHEVLRFLFTNLTNNKCLSVLHLATVHGITLGIVYIIARFQNYKYRRNGEGTRLNCL